MLDSGFPVVFQRQAVIGGAGAYKRGKLNETDIPQQKFSEVLIPIKVRHGGNTAVHSGVIHDPVRNPSPMSL